MNVNTALSWNGINHSPFTKGFHRKEHLNFDPLFGSLMPARAQMDLESLVNKTIRFFNVNIQVSNPCLGWDLPYKEEGNLAANAGSLAWLLSTSLILINSGSIYTENIAIFYMRKIAQSSIPKGEKKILKKSYAPTSRNHIHYLIFHPATTASSMCCLLPLAHGRMVQVQGSLPSLWRFMLFV